MIEIDVNSISSEELYKHLTTVLLLVQLHL